MAAYLDHVAYRVQNMDWTVDFFAQVFEMTVTRTVTADNGLRNIWLSGGLQLVEEPDFGNESGRAHHVCLLVDDLEGARQKALDLGCKELTKHHWVELPDGLQVELFAAREGVVETLKNLPKKK